MQWSHLYGSLNVYTFFDSPGILVILGGHGGIYHATYGSHASCLFLPSPMRACFFVQISCLSSNTNLSHLSILIRSYGLYTELDPKIIRRIVNMEINGYSQLIDIVNFCGKQNNISSSKEHIALIYCQWSNDLGFITRSSNNLRLYHKAF